MNRSISATIGFALVLGILSGCLPQTSPEAQKQTITLFFYSESDLQSAYFDRPIAVHRRIPASDDAMDTALRQLFAGPTDEEGEKGARTSDDLTGLKPLYLGVRQEGEAAVVNFKEEALKSLNSAAARQFMVKSPIRATLLQFPGITEVKYAIDGKIFEEWDA